MFAAANTRDQQQTGLTKVKLTAPDSYFITALSILQWKQHTSCPIPCCSYFALLAGAPALGDSCVIQTHPHQEHKDQILFIGWVRHWETWSSWRYLCPLQGKVGLQDLLQALLTQTILGFCKYYSDSRHPAFSCSCCQTLHFFPLTWRKNSGSNWVWPLLSFRNWWCLSDIHFYKSHYSVSSSSKKSFNGLCFETVSMLI